jgi:hypothetical protein
VCASRVKFSSFPHALLISYTFLNIYLFAIYFVQRTLAPLNGQGGVSSHPAMTMKGSVQLTRRIEKSNVKNVFDLRKCDLKSENHPPPKKKFI